MDKNLLLTSAEMAQFASTGFLRFDNLVPRELCEASHNEMSSGKLKRRAAMGVPFSELWPEEAIGKVFRLSKVEIEEGVVEHFCDMYYSHLRKAGKEPLLQVK